MSKDPLDDMIKKALERIEEEQRAPDWEDFSSELQENELTDFDQELKDHLNGVSFPATGAWERFEDKYAQATDSDHSIDETVRGHLKDHQPTYNDRSWLKLSALLDLTEIRERNILIQKLSELSIFAFFTFILIPVIFQESPTQAPEKMDAHLYAMQKTSTEPNDSQTAMDKSNATAIAELPQRNNPKDEDHNRSTAANSFAERLNAPATDGEAKKSEIELLNSVLSLSDEERAVAIQNNDSRTGQVEASFEPLSLLPSLEHPTGIIETAYQDQPNKNVVFDLSDQSIKMDRGTSGEETFSEEALAFINYLGIDELEQKPVLPPTLIKAAPIMGNTSVGLFVAPVLNMVGTPYDPVYQVREHNQVKPATAFGLEVEHSKGKASYGGSISYQEFDYTPPLITEVYGGSLEEGYQAVRLEKINLSLASVSIFARQYYALSQKLKIFGHFGGSINMALQADYDIKNGILTNNGAIVPQNLEDFQPSEGAKTPDLLLKKEFNQGLLDGGGFNENSFMAIEIGAGLCYKINNQTELFSSVISNFSPFRDGIGPNRDKLQNLSLRLGCRTYL